ncbi:MAG TPA: hypothetical protein P5234_12610 [Thermoanaerobaculaceae bacterium]|nr:hypothetical protein [Thermoanaerobaculaceae bacterium]HRS17073.1 hypothetical protein [Thermoanaerobaculaceae bacterium]
MRVGGSRGVFTQQVASVALCLVAAAASADDSACFECHGSPEQVREAAAAMELQLDEARVGRLVVGPMQAGTVHAGVACIDCHAGAEEIPHPADLLRGNPCAACHEDALAAVNRSTHRDPAGGASLRAGCWACHGAHDVRPANDPDSNIHPAHVAERCLGCHAKREYLRGEHGRGVQIGGLDFAATCVSCHGGHDVQPHRASDSRVARRNVSKTCGQCHGRVERAYLKSVHGAALAEHDNHDVPTCVDCHAAHNTQSAASNRFRLDSARMCGRCHGDKAMMQKYGISTAVFETYVADFHGTTAELFRATSPDQPLNQAVCYDCHGFHDVESTRRMGDEQVKERLLVRCQACHPAATRDFLSAWTSHYEPSRDRYPLIYWVRLFYWWVIPGTVGFFLAYIALDVWGRRRHRRVS